MADQARIAFSVVRTLSGMPIPKEEFLEAATQTFKKGAPVVLNAAGYITECGADPAMILGIATRDGQNGTAAGDKKQVIELAHVDNCFLGNLDNGLGTIGGTQATIGAAGYGIAKHAGSGKWYIDGSDTTAKRVKVWKFYDEGLGLITDNLARFFFSIDPTYMQFNKTA